MNIGIFIDNTNKNWGPGKLALNTIKGLERNNINHKINDFFDYNLCVSGNQFQWKFYGHNVKNPIIGPCSFNDPSQYGQVFNLYPKFLVASDWYKKNWMSYGVEESKLDSWFGGIDTDLFKPNKDLKYDCLILFKNRGSNELELIQNVLNKHNLTSIILSYGNYDENKFIDFANSCRFCIVLHNTETQGFAIMEMMSMNLPMIVFDCNNWEGRFFEATSTPYFDDTCGIKVKQTDLNYQNIETNLNNFLNNLERYNPRDFILNGFTIEHSIINLKQYFSSVWG